MPRNTEGGEPDSWRQTRAAREDELVERARGADVASQFLFLSGMRHAVRAEEIASAAARVGRVSQEVAAAGARELEHALDVLDAATDVEVASALIGSLTWSDLNRGLELARVSGELDVVGRIVRQMRMPVLESFMQERSRALSDQAVRAIVRAAGTRMLATALAVTGADIGSISASEVEASFAQLEASGALARASSSLASRANEERVAASASLAESTRLGELSREATADALLVGSL
jgi:hypothetical protein